MKKLKIDTFNYSKVYPKFKIIPFVSILFVIAYISLSFIKMLNYNGEMCSAFDLARIGGMLGASFILPQVVVIITFVVVLFISLKNKTFTLLDLSAPIGSLFGFLALFSIVFVMLTKTIGGAIIYVQWLILIPIIFLAIGTLANFVCCLLSGKTKLPIAILICHCACAVLFVLLVIVISFTPLIQLEEQSYGIFVDGQIILFNEVFISIYGESEMLIIAWAIIGLAAFVLENLIEKISQIVEMYKSSLLFNNDYFLEFALKDEYAYIQTQKGKLKVESALLDSCRRDLSIKNGVILTIVGLVLLIIKTDFVANLCVDVLQGYLPLLRDISSVVCWTTLLVGVAINIITVVTKRITYKKLVEIEETVVNDNGTIKQEKRN